MGVLACSDDNSNDPLGINEDETGGDDAPATTTGADGTEPTSADGETEDGSEGCGMPDPECTTNAACGNDEICVECMCVEAPPECDDVVNGDCTEDAHCGPNETCTDCECTHPCTNGKEDECTSDSQCESGACDPKSCTCEMPPSCSTVDECDADDDCMGLQTCNLSTCQCEGMCECQAGGPLCGDGQYCDGCSCQPVPGTSDPAGDCDADGTPIECTPSTDLLGTDVTCDAGMITVTAYFEEPVGPAPATPMRRIVEFLDPLGYLTLRLWASAPGDGGAYECSVIVPGVMMTDIGPDDVCEINPDGSFQFALSADSEMLATGSIMDLFARSESSDPYHYDDGDPIPNPCM